MTSFVEASKDIYKTTDWSQDGAPEGIKQNTFYYCNYSITLSFSLSLLLSLHHKVRPEADLKGWQSFYRRAVLSI